MNNSKAYELNIDKYLKIITIIGSAIVFIWGVIQFSITQAALAETRHIEARKPFLDRQLQLYTEASKAASTLATSDDKEELSIAEKKFWSLYWGELALVEDSSVETAMVKFGRELQLERDPNRIKQLSLELAHACRNSLAKSWGVTEWRNPHDNVE